MERLDKIFYWVFGQNGDLPGHQPGSGRNVLQHRHQRLGVRRTGGFTNVESLGPWEVPPALGERDGVP